MYARFAVIPCLLGALLFGGMAVAAEGTKTEVPLSGTDVQQMIGDHGVLLDAIIFRGGQRNAAYLIAPNGHAAVVWLSPGGAIGQDNGTWSIKGDQLCFSWNMLNSGGQVCGRTVKVGDNAYQFRGNLMGEVIFSYHIRQ